MADPIWVHSREVRVVAITGGTHGNETTGVALARHLLRHPDLAARPSFETKVVLSNVEAIKKNVRYVEEDMNRCFFKKDLADATLTSLEARRAKEINAALGPKGSSSPVADLIIDLHNTTANTGVALMMPPQDALSHAIGAYLLKQDARVRVVNYTAGKSDYPQLPTIGRTHSSWPRSRDLWAARAFLKLFFGGVLSAGGPKTTDRAASAQGTASPLRSARCRGAASTARSSNSRLRF